MALNINNELYYILIEEQLNKDEAKLMENAANADETYVNEVLPNKMKYNLEEIKRFGVCRDIKIMF